jgi:CheY-like chemotaxis protein
MSDTSRIAPPAGSTDHDVDASAASHGDGLEGVNVSLADVGELRRSLREAEEGRAHAEQANKAKDARLAALAHELRTPLASMLLHAQLLREGGTMDQRDLKRIGDSLERAVQQQTQLIDALVTGSSEASRELTLDRVQSEEVRADGARLQRSATWTLTFPLSSSSSEGDSSDQTTPIPHRSLDRPGKDKQYEALKDIRILYIDDDFVTREAVLEVLELTGARIALAASTADGMMALQAFKPHVIVCDLAMPGEDGYAFIRKLRASEAGKASTIPVLAFTGRASAEDRHDALAAGFQMYLSKPIDIDRLRDSVAQLVGLIGSRRTVAPSA